VGHLVTLPNPNESLDEAILHTECLSIVNVTIADYCTFIGLLSIDASEESLIPHHLIHIGVPHEYIVTNSGHSQR